MAKRPPTGYVIYDGPSAIDGAPIVAIALTGKSSNAKTGRMLQTYILRADVDPRAANKAGADRSICGDCPHRGVPTDDPARTLAKDRTCYVTMGQGPLIVYRTYSAGKYPKVRGHADISDLGRGRYVRLGTYGDPAAVPSYVWESLTSEAKGRTGYSHQCGVSAEFNPRLTMVSADTLGDAKAAWSRGWRTFRVVSSVDDITEAEILCPASEEAGRRTTCIDCRLCGGSEVKAKSIAIPAHGVGKANFGKGKSK